MKSGTGHSRNIGKIIASYKGQKVVGSHGSLLPEEPQHTKKTFISHLMGNSYIRSIVNNDRLIDCFLYHSITCECKNQIRSKRTIADISGLNLLNFQLNIILVFKSAHVVLYKVKKPSP